ncbi:MAG: hypothetical protein Q7T72_01740 [Bacteroidales bacterium]|nr:hypothetical protein [Bacteroidales bacterium]MDP3001812.1 hypothetical protein [Bacteroidales bacterium]
MKKYLFVFLIQIPLLGSAQEEKKLGVELNGSVRTDIFFDSRQTEDLREGHFLLYPKSKLLDNNGKDINASPKFNLMSIDTRLTALIKGPDAFGAKTSGLIEGEFYGNINSDINGFRLRHAMVKLTWETSELMVGQFWHPMFITSSFPGTVSFNTGAPFQPFARNPQIRLTKKLGNINLIGTLLEQIDFTSTGPSGASPKYLINSALPELNFRIEYKSDDFLFGGGCNYKSIMPRLYVETVNSTTNSKVKTNERVSGVSVFTYAQLTLEPVTISTYGYRGQMMYSMTNLGGYAEKEFVYENAKLTNITYTPINTMSLWTDVHTNGKTLQFGFFGGYTKNHGASDSISTAGKVYARGDDIDYIYRISPRVIYNSGKFRVAPEIEYTVAAFATTNEQTGLLNVNNKRAVTRSKETGNFRFLIGVYYFF